jgi:hypothetical protein
MKSSILGLLFLFVVCVSLPFLFKFAEGMTYRTDDVDPKTQAGYSRKMDPEEDIYTVEEDLDSKFFDTIHSGSYYADDGEDERKYLSGKHNIRAAEPSNSETRTAQDVMNRRAANEVDTDSDVKAVQDRYKDRESERESDRRSERRSDRRSERESSRSDRDAERISDRESSRSDRSSQGPMTTQEQIEENRRLTKELKDKLTPEAFTNPLKQIQDMMDQLKPKEGFVDRFKRSVFDLSNNVWDISNNYNLYNKQGVLNTGRYVSYADLDTLEKEYEELEDKCSKMSTSIICSLSLFSRLRATKMFHIGSVLHTGKRVKDSQGSHRLGGRVT